MTIKDIDFAPCMEWISSIAGIDAKLTIKFDKFDGGRPKIVCPNLINDSGIFHCCLIEVKVDFFNMSFIEESGTFWATVYLNYMTVNGGTNGVQIGTVWYDPINSWAFSPQKKY